MVVQVKMIEHLWKALQIYVTFHGSAVIMYTNIYIYIYIYIMYGNPLKGFNNRFFSPLSGSILQVGPLLFIMGKLW